MRIGIKVGDIMTRDFVSANPNDSIKKCAELMIKKRVGSLVILEGKKLRGMVTERDIIWAMTKKPLKELEKIKCIEIAKKKVRTVKPSADIFEALQKMKKSKYRWLPVTSSGNVIGFLTLKDILTIEPALFEIAQMHESFRVKDENEKLKRKELAIKGKGFQKEGVCEECGSFDLLYSIDNKLVCESCADAV